MLGADSISRIRYSDMLSASDCPRTSTVTCAAVPGQVDRSLPGGVGATDHEHLAALHGLGL